MNCEQACACIKPFIEGNIGEEKLSGFLQHVQHCKSCYEELDIMYIVSEGLEGLKSDSDSNFNFSGMLAGKLQEGSEFLKRSRRRRIIGTSIQFIAYASLVLVSFRFFGIL